MSELAYRVRLRHRGRSECTVRRDTQLVLKGFARAGSTFIWLAFRSAQLHPVRLAHHTHAPAQVITAVRWNIPPLVVVRDPADSVLAHMALHPLAAAPPPADDRPLGSRRQPLRLQPDRPPPRRRCALPGLR